MRMSMYLTDGCDSTSKYTGYTSDVNFNAIGTDSIKEIVKNILIGKTK